MSHFCSVSPSELIEKYKELFVPVHNNIYPHVLFVPIKAEDLVRQLEDKDHYFLFNIETRDGRVYLDGIGRGVKKKK